MEHLDPTGSDDSLQTVVSSRVFIERIINERHRFYLARFESIEAEIKAVLGGLEKFFTEKFVASDKAIIKAEDAQREYNNRSNEFRGQLDDQAKTLLARSEAAVQFRSLEDKLDILRANVESKRAIDQANENKAFDEIKKELASLRESRSEGGGRDKMIAYLIAASFTLLSFGVSIFIALRR